MLTQPDHSHQSPRVRHRGLGLVSCIWLLAFVSAGLWLLLGPSATDSQKQIAEVSAQPTELASFHQPVDSRYRNIEQIRVGQRVVTPEASSAAGLPTAVDPLTWKKLTLQAKARWEDGTIDDIEVQTLQPSSWLALHQAVVGASVPIPLDLREMGLPQMNATVMAIDPCPAIEEGPGRVVLTTVNHLNRFLFDLKVHGKRGPPQAVEVTGWHKLFSEDRQAWTSVCELHLGEVLRGREGELTVESLSRHPGVDRVYNLTVEQEHQYYVSAADVLAHNNACLPTVEISASKYPELADNIRNAQLAGHPDVLTYGGDVSINRPDALRDVPNVRPLSRDEYPFASTVEGGEGSWVGHIPKSQQNAQGGILKNFYERNNMRPGDKFRVVVVP